VAPSWSPQVAATCGSGNREASVARRRFLGLGPRRLLQLSLVIAAAIALLLALTGALTPLFSALAAAPSP
jgi:hypothetical protein